MIRKYLRLAQIVLAIVFITLLGKPAWEQTIYSPGHDIPIIIIGATGLWADPPSGFTAAAGVDSYPTVTQPSLTNDLVGFRLQNTSSSTAIPAGYITKGCVFLDDATHIKVMPTDTLVARIPATGGANYYVQMNVLATNSDGSVRHAVCTFKTPSTIAANSSLDVMLAKCASGCPSAPSPAAPSTVAALLAPPFSYSLNVPFTFRTPQVPTIYCDMQSLTTISSLFSGGGYYNLKMAGWQVGDPLSQLDGDIAGGTTISSISGDGTTVTVSAPLTKGYASFTGSVSGITLTATSVTGGIAVGATLSGSGVGGTLIASQLSGSTGGAGTYSLSANLGTIGSEAMVAQHLSEGPVTTHACTNNRTPGTVNVTASAATCLGGTVTNWISGPAVTEFDCMIQINSNALKVKFHARAYADGTFITEVVMDNSGWFNNRTDLRYDISFPDGYSQTNFSHANSRMWPHTVYTGTIIPVEDGGSLNVQYDAPYLMAWGPIPYYDTSYGVNDAFIQANFTAMCSTVVPTQTGCVPLGSGLGDPSFGISGGGSPEYALYPAYDVHWLLTQDATARKTMMQQSVLYGGVPWRYIDESTQKPISTETYSDIWSGATVPAWAQHGYMQPPAYTNGNVYNFNPEHEGGYVFIPYVISPTIFGLDNIQQEANLRIQTTFLYANGFTLDNGTANPPAGGALPYRALTIWEWNGSNYVSASNTPRQGAWNLRDLLWASFITPDTDSMKTYFNTEAAQPLAASARDYITNNIESAYGVLTGFWPFHDLSVQGDGANVIWEQAYMGMVLSMGARMGIPTVSTNASNLIQWMTNWMAGQTIHGPDGFNPLSGMTYHNQMDGDAVDGGNVCTNPAPVRNPPHTTWAIQSSKNVWSPWVRTSSNSCMPIAADTSPGIIVDYVPGSTCNGGYCGAFPTNVLGTVTEELTQSWEPRAIEAFAFEQAQIQYAYCCDATYGGFIVQADDIQHYPTFVTTPKLPNGNLLRHDQFFFDNSVAGGTTTPTTSDCLVAAVASNRTGGGTATLNGCSGVAILYGPKGTGILNASTGDTWMFGHWEATSTTFSDGAGTNYMKGGGTANNFKFNIASAKTTEIANFNPATDHLTVKSNLNGNGITTAAGVYATCSVAGGKTTCNLGTGNKTITLDGLTSNIGPSGSNRIVID